MALTRLAAKVQALNLGWDHPGSWELLGAVLKLCTIALNISRERDVILCGTIFNYLLLFEHVKHICQKKKHAFAYICVKSILIFLKFNYNRKIL